MRLMDVRGLMLPEETARLAVLARTVRSGQVIIEVGSHTGLSTCYLGSAAAAGVPVIAIDPYRDPDPQWEGDDDPFALGDGGALAEFTGNLTGLRLWGKVIPLRSTSEEVARMWLTPVGLCFIDSVHTYDHFLTDYWAWAPHIASGGYLACHDYTPDESHKFGGVGKALREVVLPTGDWEEPTVTEYLWAARKR